MCHRWDFILNGYSYVVEFWDSKLSGKKKIAVNSKIIYFDEQHADILFYVNFKIGYNVLTIRQYAEDRFDLFVDGNRFNELMIQERYEKKASMRQKEKEKQKKKKTEEEYYRRALKYNGNDYYEGKEKALLDNNINNNININNNVNNNKYNYEYYKNHRNNNINNYNNNIYGYDNNMNNNNYENNYDYNKFYQERQNQINQNINQNNNQQYNNNNYNNDYDNYNPFMEEEPKENNNGEINNPYPNFSVHQNQENNISKNNYQNQNQNHNPKSIKNSLPTYSEIVKGNQFKNQLNKMNNKDSTLVNYIGNLNSNNNNNNIQPSSIECAPNANNNQG